MIAIREMTADAEILACFPAFAALRPHLYEADFVATVRRQQQEGYRIIAVQAEDGTIPAAAGFRYATFLAWGHVLYIDDLTTLPAAQGRGYGGALLDWLIAAAQAQGCNAVHLDTGYTRQAAHRLYLNKGFVLSAHHCAREL